MHASSETVHPRVRFIHAEVEFLGQFANNPATGNGPIPDVVGHADSHDSFYETQLESRTLFHTDSVGSCMGDPTPALRDPRGRDGQRRARRGTRGRRRTGVAAGVPRVILLHLCSPTAIPPATRPRCRASARRRG